MAINLTGSANGFVINVPQFNGASVDNGNAPPAFALNFDFGANPSQIAQQAYNFVNQSFGTDQSFLSGSIGETQQFLAHQISPIITQASNQISANAQILPQLYSSISKASNSAISAIGQFTQNGLNTQNELYQSSIAASNAAANSGGGCFITTAVCKWHGDSDDCEMLKDFREFRDSWVRLHHPKSIAEYYANAPQYVALIDTRIDASVIYREMYREFLIPAQLALRINDYESAYEIYCELVQFAEACAMRRDNVFA